MFGNTQFTKMTLMNPEFGVGETVAVRSALNSYWNTNDTMVLRVEMFGPNSLLLPNGQFNDGWGFWYRLSHVRVKNHWVCESSLRRLPPPKTISFNEMMVDLISTEA